MMANSMVNNSKIRLFSDALNAVKAIDSCEKIPDLHNIKTCITDLVDAALTTIYIK